MVSLPRWPCIHARSISHDHSTGCRHTAVRLVTWCQLTNHMTKNRNCHFVDKHRPIRIHGCSHPIFVWNNNNISTEKVRPIDTTKAFVLFQAVLLAAAGPSWTYTSWVLWTCSRTSLNIRRSFFTSERYRYSPVRCRRVDATRWQPVQRDANKDFSAEKCRRNAAVIWLDANGQPGKRE